MVNLTTESSDMDLPAMPGLTEQMTLKLQSEEGECPFVNRSDSRCAEHLTMGGVGYAYDHCFGSYKSCSMYRELLQERRSGALVAARVNPAVVAAEATGRPAAETPGTWHRLRNRLVELTVGRRRLDRAA